MSEPYCVLSRCQIARERVQEFLKAPRKRASAYDDWVRCTGFIDVDYFQTPESMDEWVSEVDTHAGASFGDALQRHRGFALQPSFFRFYYDGGVLHQASLLYSQGASDLVEYLTASRGICDFLQNGEKGIVAVHDPFWGNGTVGVVSLAAGQSRVIDSDPETEKMVSAMLGELPSQAELEENVQRDELDSFLLS